MKQNRVDRRKFLQYSAAGVGIVIIAGASINVIAQNLNTSEVDAASVKDLENWFINLPEEARPWVYWYWMRANVTSEGITRDLEAMAEAGVGGAYLMTIGNANQQTLVDTPANSLSEAWWELVIHATKEAERLGLRLAMNACDGWALAGGPWITPELSMQEIVTTTTIIEGGKPFVGKLDQPLTRKDYYRDVVTLAWPVIEGTVESSTQLNPKATTNIPGFDPRHLVQPTDQQVVLSAEGWIQFEFDEPFTCRSIFIQASQREGYQLHRSELQVSSNGKDFRSLGRLKPTQFHGFHDQGVGGTHAIEPTTARFFRFVLDRAGTPPHSENQEGAKRRNRDRLLAAHVKLSSQPRIGHWEGKAGYRWRRSERTTAAECPDDLCVSTDQILNLTEKMAPDGTLNWTPPPGQWSIQRIGYTTTGAENAPAGTGAGLECDKFNPEAARVQFQGWFGEALNRVGPELAGKTLTRNHTDSWECDSQNWSPLYREEFIRRRGYDPLPWLPVMSGVPIASAELSERFLYDMRRTAADLICDNFYDPFVKIGQEHGTSFSAECVAPMMTSDGLQHFKYVDMPMGEFWLHTVDADKPNDIKDAVSAGHIYGKNIIGAEAFTSRGIKWTEDPYYFKTMGDYNFAMGINKFMLHVWCHQAFDKAPGVTLNATYGAVFSGTQTWQKPGKAWYDYIHRCSAMLQQGLPIADVCYFTGEELPSRSYLRHDLPLPLNEGYAYDCINRDALMTLASAKDGRLVLPHGISYCLLVLPPSEVMTPELAKKIGELALAGVPVIGTLPTRSISLSNYPECDKKVRDIVEASWKSVRTKASTQTILDELQLRPDVEFSGVDMTPFFHQEEEYFSPPLVWNHRQTDEADIYFISNQEHQVRNVDAAFRITGRVPELWDAETGAIRDASIWREEKGRTIVSLRLAPAGSLFIVFRQTGRQMDPVTKITPSEEDFSSLAPLWIENYIPWASENGEWQITRQSGKKMKVSINNLSEPKEIRGPWTVTFPTGSNAAGQISLAQLQSLSEHSDPGVKHFSGTSSYSTSFKYSQESKGKRLFLDLGEVTNLAEITVNGQNLGVLWKPPFIADITDALKPGTNTLRIDVTNTWKNRLIGDSGLPAGERTTWTWGRENWFSPDEPLEPSGLLGPVMLIEARSLHRIQSE